MGVTEFMYTVSPDSLRVSEEKSTYSGSGAVGSDEYKAEVG
jgi:hypothetical protein